jgi:NADH:ubiquinone oxidoreductase 24 kD subunit
MNKSLSEIFSSYPNPSPDQLIPLLQDIQENEGYLPHDILKEVSRFLNIPMSSIYGVATFYNQFRLHAPGKYHLQVCRGTACHVYGSTDLMAILQNELGINVGHTTSDGMFSLEIVSCIGVCGLAPILTINGKVYPKVSAENMRQILSDLRSKANYE